MASAPPPFTPGSTAIPATSVELSVACRKLIDSDLFSKSDPMCVLFIMHPGGKEWREFGRTEIIWNQLNPVFVKKFIIQYYFEESQRLKFEIYDVDSKSPRLQDHDFLGSMECTLAEIVTDSKLHRRLKSNVENEGGSNVYGASQGGPKKDSGSISIVAEELTVCKENVLMQLRGHKLDKKDLFGKSDPYLLFYRCNEDGRTLKIECYDWDSDGGHDFIGEFVTNLRELSRGPGTHNVYELINPKKQKKSSKYKNSGTIELMQCKVETVHTFIDFIKGG